MAKSAELVPPMGGFSFDLCKRNAMLVQKGLKQPSYLKTGTTIVGLIFQVDLFFFFLFLICAFVYCDFTEFVVYAGLLRNRVSLFDSLNMLKFLGR